MTISYADIDWRKIMIKSTQIKEMRTILQHHLTESIMAFKTKQPLMKLRKVYSKY